MNLRDWLKAQGKTQVWLAKAMGSSQSHVSNWVNQKVVPTIDTIAKLNKITKGKVGYPDFVQRKK